MEQKVFDYLKPIIEDLGYELVAVKQGNPYGVYTIRVIIFKKGQMGLDDCERVHKAIDEPLDNLNPTDDKPYNLEVSSMGLDWQIKTDDDYRRRLDDLVEFSLFGNIEGQNKIVGKLISYDENSVEIIAKVGKKGALREKNIIIERKAIAKAIPYVKF